MYISTAASPLRGTTSNAVGNSTRSSSTHAPAMIALCRSVAPACTLAEDREITPVVGGAPSSPHTRLPTPSAISSRSLSLASPSPMPSTALLHSSVSAEQTNVSARRDTQNAGDFSSSKSSAAGVRTASRIVSGMSTVSIGRPNAAAMAVAAPAAAKAPGTTRTRFGIDGQNAMIASASSPTPAASCFGDPSGGHTPSATVAGIASRFLSPPPGPFASNRTCTCEARISTPIPASIPWITAGETARNACPSFSTPPRIVSPAITGSATPSAPGPNSVSSAATITAGPALGPEIIRRLPVSEPTTTPPTTAVISPRPASTPHRIAIPIDSGTLISATTNEAERFSAHGFAAASGLFAVSITR